MLRPVLPTIAALAMVATAAFAGQQATIGRFATPPTIDGTIEPGEWQRALQVTGMRSQKARPPWKTLEERMASVYCGFTAERLYVAVVSELPPNGKLNLTRRGRDSVKTVFDSSVEIWAAPYNETPEGPKVGGDFFQFIVNGNGDILDNSFLGGKPGPGWNADWEVANTIQEQVADDAPAWQKKHGVWVCEISVPFADIGMQGDPNGRTLGLLIARNWHKDWDQSTWFPLHGPSWTDPSNYPTVRLAADDPAVQLEDLGPSVFDGTLQLRASIHNPGPAREVAVDLRLESSSMPGLSDTQRLALPAGGSVEYAYDIPPERFHAIAKHDAHFLVTSADGEFTYLDWRTKWSKAAENPWPGVRIGPQPERAVRLAYYPSYKFVRINANTAFLAAEGKGARKAEVVITDADDKVLLQDTMTWDGTAGTAEFNVGALPDGEYTAAVTVRGEDYERSLARTFRRTHYVWEGNRLGKTRRVYPPFKPIEVDGDRLDVVMRRHRVDGLGLWRSVQARGNEAGYKELLAAPMRLVANGQALEGEGAFSSTAGDKAVFEGRAEHPAVRVNTRTITEYDGCMKVELTLAPGTGEALDALALEIPLHDVLAPLYHVSSTSLRRNPAGRVPEGQGRIWDSRDYPDGEWIGNFKCYLWVGGAERGLCFFADNDRHWVLKLDEENPAESAPCQELIRRDGVLTLRVNFVQQPVVLDEPRTIVFGLMASPAKPMPENWRNILLSNQWHYAGKLPGYRTLEWGGSTYWGCAETMKETYPLNRDMSVLNKIQEARISASTAGMQEFVRAWERRNLADYEQRGRRKSADQIRKLVQHSIRRSAATHADFQTWYWEEFHNVTAHHPETQVFGNEWSGGYRIGGMHPLTDSYLDFQCWYGAEFIRRGIGLYFDNTYPKQAKDPLTTAAYRRPDGRIQASANMWRHREYFKRIWVLHQQLAQPEKKPVMMFHMTNSQIVPTMSFGQTQLDLEWRYSDEPFQARFSPALLRTQSTGLQTGNLPFALAQKRGAPGRMGGLMVHEIRCWFIKENAKLMRHLLEFGYGQSDCEVTNYWDDKPPLTVDDDQCKWLLLKRNNALLVLLCTWNAEPKQLDLVVRDQALNVDAQQAIDVSTGETLSVDNGTLRFKMPGYGTRILRL